LVGVGSAWVRRGVSERSANLPFATPSTAISGEAGQDASEPVKFAACWPCL